MYAGRRLQQCVDQLRGSECRLGDSSNMNVSLPLSSCGEAERWKTGPEMDLRVGTKVELPSLIQSRALTLKSIELR